MPLGIYKRPSLPEKFWIKVEKTPDCWNWIGSINSYGYGQIGVDRACKMAHRISYELLVGKIPKGLQLDHLCENKKCVNPTHLEPVTARVNTLRGGNTAAKNARKTHCKRGHPLSGNNLRVYKYKKSNPARICRECKASLLRELRKRKLLNITKKDGETL